VVGFPFLFICLSVFLGAANYRVTFPPTIGNITGVYGIHIFSRERGATMDNHIGPKKLLHFTTSSGKMTVYHKGWERYVNCPYCGGQESKVVDSRSLYEGVRRRRECLACNARFTTYERVQPRDVFVIKKDGRREKFSRDKLLTGIRKACEKRPLPTGAIDKFVDTVEAELYKVGKSEVSSSYIGDLVMEGLRKLDHIAYIRFASVYREFADIGDLIEEVDSLAVRREAAPANQLPLVSSESVNSSTGPKRR
jgi:transcriptional repressor NrdR